MDIKSLKKAQKIQIIILSIFVLFILSGIFSKSSSLDGESAAFAMVGLLPLVSLASLPVVIQTLVNFRKVRAIDWLFFAIAFVPLVMGIWFYGAFFYGWWFPVQ